MIVAQSTGVCQKSVSLLMSSIFFRDRYEIEKVKMNPILTWLKWNRKEVYNAKKLTVKEESVYIWRTLWHYKPVRKFEW